MPRLKKLEPAQAVTDEQPALPDIESKKTLLNFYQAMANSPAVLDGYLKFTRSLRQGKLDDHTRQAIGLAVSQTHGCQYSLAALTQISRQSGLSDATIRDARKGRSSNVKTNAALSLARALVAGRGQVSDTDFDAARQAGLDDGEIVEVVALVALSIFANYLNCMNQTEVEGPKVPLEID